ncbi:MAG: hypothetical protein AAF410_04255 [Pseudomonadota bacterium]
MIYVAFTWGLADVYYRPSLNDIRSWIIEDKDINDDSWDRLYSNLMKAQQLDPSNPDIRENLAIALEGRYAKFAAGEIEAETNRNKALAHYRTSVSLRPSWPYAWNSLMAVKFRLGQIDKEFFNVFHQAERLGRWEPDIQRMLVNIGLMNWLQFPASERAYLLEIVKRSLQKQPNEILDIAKNYGLLDVICLLNKEIENVAKTCSTKKQ